MSSPERVDEHGIVRWVHRGPDLHRDPQGEHGLANRDYNELEAIATRWFVPAAVNENGR